MKKQTTVSRRIAAALSASQGDGRKLSDKDKQRDLRRVEKALRDCWKLLELELLLVDIRRGFQQSGFGDAPVQPSKTKFVSDEITVRLTKEITQYGRGDFDICIVAGLEYITLTHFVFGIQVEAQVSWVITENVLVKVVVFASNMV